MKRISAVLLALFGMLLFCERSYGLAQERVGPDKSAVAQPDWPKGIVELARHPSRVYSIWVNGGESFYFKASPEEIQELVDLFAKTRMRDHEIRIEPGVGTAKSFSKTEYDYNVALHIVGGIARAIAQDRNAAAPPEPILTIHAGTNGASLRQLKLPDNAILSGDLEGTGLQGNTNRPIRKLWYGSLQWDDESPAIDFEHGLSTCITLWEPGFKDGVQLEKLGRSGIFSAAFSEAEMAELKSGRSWLTVTVGNWLTEARREDTKYPAEFLASEKENAKPLKISRPGFYYGRVLFEDGSPAVLNPGPWPGAEIWVDFPYAGSGHLDKEGYFQVFFKPEQLAELKSRKKQGKNIYVPTRDRGSSVAGDTFPAELLSQDKAKAGEVRIQKPVFQPVYDFAQAPSLLGKPLLPLTSLGLAETTGASGNGMVLLCFFDLQERPSRHCLTQLVQQAADLKATGLFVAGVQASAVDPKTVEGFAKTEKVPFPLGRIAAEEEKTRFDWGIKSLPWFILADNAHIVRAEGFTLAELKDKLAAAASGGK